MTERALSITSQIAPTIQAVHNASNSSSTNDALPVNESIEEEPYTIKCICSFSDDDGNTIYCEQCDTWQHIECYYPGRVADASKEEFDHSCSDCKPRPLDSKLATERQRQQRQNKAASETGDKKSKRPPSSKSHKKKVKPSEVQVNGYHEPDGHKNGSPHEHQPHTKKAKGHRSNQSVSSTKRSPHLHSRTSNHGHPPSPAQTLPDLPSDVQVHSYSDDFLSLYDNDETKHSATTNSFASLQATNKLAIWLQQPEMLAEETGNKNKEDVFQALKVPIESLKWPDLRIETKEKRIEDNILQWRYLTALTPSEAGRRMVELNGLLGIQADYCNDPANRWQETVHPRPFVFFHPRLPLFIDTRLEGSKGRYVRRSCRPNTAMETFIVDNSEYHFWLISERPIPAKEPLTIPWDFKFPPHNRARILHLLNLGDDDGPPVDCSDITDDEYESLTSTIHLVLSDHGGCACDLGNDCAFARFHRSYHGRLQNQTNGVKPKKARKPKQNHISPTSTGHATNSRAASEGQDQYDEDDSHSQSGSVRSKPRSRDLTPMRGISDTNGILTEPSDREKRKLAMLEDSFRKMENGPRKKKRVSDGSSHALPSTGQTISKPRKGSTAPRALTSQANNGPRSRQFVDASTSRGQSGSPFSAVSPNGGILANNAAQGDSIPYRSRPTSPTPRSTYTDSSTQTDPVEDAWWESKPKPKRTILPLAKRLLKNRHKIQAQQEVQAEQSRQEAERRPSLTVSPTVPMEIDTASVENSMPSPTDAKGRQASASSTISADTPHDVIMTDAPPSMVAHTIKLPPPWPNNSTISSTGLNSSNHKSELRVQLPSPPVFSTPNMSGNPSAPSTPSIAASSTAQSPFGSIYPNALPPQLTNGVNPSPVKPAKRVISLSEYNNKKKIASKSASESSPTVTPATLKASLPAVAEEKSTILEDSAIIDTPSPILEKSTDPLALKGAAIPDSKINPPPANGAM